MDYRELLKRYMSHVLENEGITYVEDHMVNTHTDAVQFTDEELAELKKIEDEVVL